MTRLTLIVCLLFVAAYCSAQSKVPTVEEILKPAYTQASKENKNIFMVFHASWCGWCHKMDTSLADPSVRPLIDKNYVTVHLTVYESNDKKGLEHPGALEFLTKHGGADHGIPYWLILDKSGNLLADSQNKPKGNVGCPASEAEVAYFINVLKKTSSLNEKQLQVVEKRFRMNEQ